MEMEERRKEICCSWACLRKPWSQNSPTHAIPRHTTCDFVLNPNTGKDSEMPLGIAMTMNKGKGDKNR